MRRKTSFELDFDKVEAAKNILGTKTLTETVDAALAEIVRGEAAIEHLDQLAALEGLDLDNPAIMAQAWH